MSRPRRPSVVLSRVGRSLTTVARTLVTAAVVTLATAAPAGAQGLEGYSGTRIGGGKDTSMYVRLLVWAQVWTRQAEENPGTMVNGNPSTASVFDVGLRRVRALAHAQLGPRLLLGLHVGINNQTFATGGVNGGDLGAGTAGVDGKRPQIFVHEAWTEFKVAPQLFIGGGLHYWNGLSRMTSASTLNFLMLDAPIVNWPTIDANDQFARTLGLYAKGSVSRLNYQVGLSRPFSIVGGQQGTLMQSVTIRIPRPGLPDTLVTGQVNVEDAAATAAMVATPTRFGIATWNPNANGLLTQGYVSWDFWQRESHALPYTVGSYLGTRKVLTVGAGWQHEPNAMRSVVARDSVTAGGVRRPVLPTDAPLPAAVGSAPGATPTANGDFRTHALRNVAVDAFMELPVGADKASITAHGALYRFDMGPNYVRNIGIMPVGVANPATRGADGRFAFAQPGFNGAGTAYPVGGTGRVAYAQAGWLLPRRWTRGFARLQPVAAVTHADFERLGAAYTMPELGMNWFFAGQNAKVSLQWRRRPLYESATLTTDGLAPVVPTTADARHNLAYPAQTGMRRAGTRSDVILQFHVHF